MNDNGFNHIIDYSNIEKINVELHYANSNDEDIKDVFSGEHKFSPENSDESPLKLRFISVYPWTAIHNDNDVDGICVNTFICYFDVDCEGGELAIYDLDEKTILSKIDVSNKTSKQFNKKIIMFSGNIIQK